MCNLFFFLRFFVLETNDKQKIKCIKTYDETEEMSIEYLLGWNISNISNEFWMDDVKCFNVEKKFDSIYSKGLKKISH